MKRLLVLAALGLFTAACPVYGKPCIPAATEPCTCSNGDDGTRVCGADKTFGACSKNGVACAARDGGSGNTNRSDGGATGPGGQDGGSSSSEDGGAVTPPDAGHPHDAGHQPPPDAGHAGHDAGTNTGNACTNLDSNNDVDPAQECTQDGTWCDPGEGTGETGTCVAGDNCSFLNQTGCPSNGTCHPAGVFGLDNQNGRLCQTAATSGGGHLAGCTTNSQCSHGFVCVPVSDTQAVCLKYCTPGRTTGAGSCSGIAGQDGGTASCFDLGEGQPSSVTSIPAGVCF